MATAQPVVTRRGPSWLAPLFGTRQAGVAVDVALLIVRLALALVFVVYGAQKLFGSFKGPGLDGTSDFMRSIDLRPGGFFAVLGGIIEFGGAIALVLGFATRIAGLALVGDMVMAIIKVTSDYGIHQPTGTGDTHGYELNVALGALALVVVLLGAGRYSVDALLERRLVGTREPSAF